MRDRKVVTAPFGCWSVHHGIDRENAGVREVRLTPELSVQIIAGSQTAAGAYPASPAHEVYRFAWLRDGSWCAHAMDRAGHRA